MRTLAAIARNACIIRFRLESRFGWFRVALAMADSWLYAGLVFLVVSAAFGRGGIDRYFLITLGIIGLRWTLSCLANADTVAPLARLMAGEVRAAPLHALVYVMAPPTLVWLGSLAAFAIVAQIAGSGENSVAGLPWFPLLLLVHLMINAAAVMLVGEAFRRGWLSSVTPVLLAAIAVWFVSPVMYRFDDLGIAGVALLTRWSSGSHLIAAYHNSFWFGQPISLEVLPAVAAAALAVTAVLLLWPRRDAGTAAGASWFTGLPDTPRLLVIDPVGAQADGAAAARRAGWAVQLPLRKVPRGLTGQDWVRLVRALRDPRAADGFADFSARVEAQAAIGDLYRRALLLYPDAALDRLATALAVARDDGKPLWLVRLFDALPRDQVPERWAALGGGDEKGADDSDGMGGEDGEGGKAGAAGDGTADGTRRIALLSNRLILPGDRAAGRFVLLRPGAAPVTGAIATGLAPAYADWLGSAAHAAAAEAVDAAPDAAPDPLPDSADQSAKSS